MTEFSRHSDSPPIDPERLDAALRHLAGTGGVLVALDYDGTLAPIVERPDEAVPAPGAFEMIGVLHRLPNTYVSLVSGRALDSLSGVAQPPSGVGLIGSHGAEGRFPPAWGVGDWDAAAVNAADVARAVDLLSTAAEGLPGSLVEIKPAGAALHTRTADSERAGPVLSRLLDELERLSDVHVRTGKAVVEVAVTDASKGAAIAVLADRLAPDAVLYIGDDRTDEDAFEVLGADDVGIKVGHGATLAEHRVADPDEVVAVLQRLTELRRPRPLG